MIVRFLGTHNAEYKDTRLVSLLIDDVLAVDAGSLTAGLTLSEQAQVKAILLSHGHYDHIRAVPAFAFNNSERSTSVLATAATLQILSSHLMDGVLYPEFTSDKSFLGKAPLQLVPVEPYAEREIEGYTVQAIPVNHPLEAVGFEITARDGKKIFYTGDTGPGLMHIWETVTPEVIIADVTWPNSMAESAAAAQHLCPLMLKQELADFNRQHGYYPRVVTIHTSPQSEDEVARELDVVARELGTPISVAREGERTVI